MSDTSPIAVFGAGGKTGGEILRRAIRRNVAVRAFEHVLPPPSARIEGIEYIECDVLNDAFADNLEGCRAIISALGIPLNPSTVIQPPPLYTEGTRKLILAMRETAIRRIAVISAAFVEPQPSIPAWFELTAKPVLHNILQEMRAMEKTLERETELDWTAARPGWLLEAPYTGEAVISDERLAEGCLRCRHADLAAGLLEFICENTWVRAKPAIGRPEQNRFEDITALKDELGIA